MRWENWRGKAGKAAGERLCQRGKEFGVPTDLTDPSDPTDLVVDTNRRQSTSADTSRGRFSTPVEVGKWRTATQAAANVRFESRQ
jgi:hypothetical protein